MIVRKILLKVILFFLMWRGALFLIAYLSPAVLTYQPSFSYPDLLTRFQLPKFLYSWANFDGVHYVEIAQNGYLKTDLIQAFFPILPLLMRLANFITGNSIISGLLISNLSLIGALYFGYKLCEKWFNKSTAINFVLILLTFPTSFYLGAVYNESLFLLLLLAGTWYYEVKKNLISGMLIGLSSGVRLVGLMMLPSFFLEWVQKSTQKPFKDFNFSKFSQNFFKTLKNQRRFILGLSIGSLAFIGYMYFLYREFNDPLYFFSVQSAFGAGRETRIILLPQVFYRSFRILLTARPFNLKYYAYAQDVVISILMGLGILLSAGKIKLTYVVFSALAYLLPTLTGNLSSMPRYVIVLFPVLMWWAKVLEEKPKLKIVYFPLAILFLVINTILFIQGYWVA